MRQRANFLSFQNFVKAKKKNKNKNKITGIAFFGDFLLAIVVEFVGCAAKRQRQRLRCVYKFRAAIAPPDDRDDDDAAAAVAADGIAQRIRCRIIVIPTRLTKSCDRRRRSLRFGVLSVCVQARQQLPRHATVTIVVTVPAALRRHRETF